MASNGAFEDEPVAEGRYSQLLLGDDEIMNLEANECFNFSPFFSSGNSPKLLRFADYQKECKTGVACSDSSSASSTKASDIITLPKSNVVVCDLNLFMGLLQLNFKIKFLVLFFVRVEKEKCFKES